MESEGSSSTFQSDLLATSVSDAFTNFLTDYIQRNGLRVEILRGVETIWVGFEMGERGGEGREGGGGRGGEGRGGEVRGERGGERRGENQVVI